MRCHQALCFLVNLALVMQCSFCSFLWDLFTAPVSGLVSMAGSSTQVRRLWEARGCEVSSGPAKFLVWQLRKVFLCSLPTRWRGRGEVGDRGAGQGSQGHPSPLELGAVSLGGRPPLWVPHFARGGGNLIRYFHRVIWGGPMGENMCYRSLYLGGCNLLSQLASEQNPPFMVCGDRLPFTVTGLSELVLHCLAV